MKPYKIFSDSSCDLPKNLIEKYNIRTIPFYVSFDMENYKREIIDISKDDFYHTLCNSTIYPKTSLPSVEDYQCAFEEVLKDGYDILCINISAKFSGSHQSAMTARSILLEKYPDSNIEVIDSLLCTGAQGLLVLQAASMQEKQFSLAETVEKLTTLKESGRLMFTLGTLSYLQKGGRIGKVSAIAGSLLNLKPLIVMSEGELSPYGKVRGFKKAVEKVTDMLIEYFTTNGLSYDDYDFTVYTGTNYEEVRLFKQQVEEVIGHTIPYEVSQIGTTVGTYTGPDIVGVAFIKKA